MLYLPNSLKTLNSSVGTPTQSGARGISLSIYLQGKKARSAVSRDVFIGLSQFQLFRAGDGKLAGAHSPLILS